jgi:hypothetical protein
MKAIPIGDAVRGGQALSTLRQRGPVRAAIDKDIIAAVIADLEVARRNVPRGIGQRPVTGGGTTDDRPPAVQDEFGGRTIVEAA